MYNYASVSKKIINTKTIIFLKNVDVKVFLKIGGKV